MQPLDARGGRLQVVAGAVPGAAALEEPQGPQGVGQGIIVCAAALCEGVVPLQGEDRCGGGHGEGGHRVLAHQVAPPRLQGASPLFPSAGEVNGLVSRTGQVGRPGQQQEARSGAHLDLVPLLHPEVGEGAVIGPRTPSHPGRVGVVYGLQAGDGLLVEGVMALGDPLLRLGQGLGGIFPIDIRLGDQGVLGAPPYRQGHRGAQKCAGGADRHRDFSLHGRPHFPRFASW